jgi:hypothetical protein
MTLKEKFKLPIDANNKINDYVADQCEKIADEFAIEFAEWLKKEGYIIELMKGSRATNKLLEIFKREKGL